MLLNTISFIEYTGSWDRTISVHDPRAQQSATTLSLPGKAYSLSLNDNKVVVATSERHILVYDMRNLEKGPEEVRESPLKFQTRTVSCFLDGSAFAVGSVEVCRWQQSFYLLFSDLLRII